MALAARLCSSRNGRLGHAENLGGGAAVDVGAGSESREEGRIFQKCASTRSSICE